MTIQNMLIALGIWILTLALTAVTAYQHGKRYQEGQDALQINTQLVSSLKEVSEANKRAEEAYKAQIENAEKYAEALSAVKVAAKSNNEEITKHVLANPAPSDCSLSDGLFEAYNKAIDSTTSFSPSIVRSGVIAGSSTTAPTN